MTQTQLEEFKDQLVKLEEYSVNLKSKTQQIEDLGRRYDTMHSELRTLRKSGLAGIEAGVRWIGNKPFVSDGCAKAITSVFVLECDQLNNGLKSLIPDASARERIKAYAMGILGRTAMSGTEIPLPTIYTPQISELVYKYGQARQYATVYPLGAGTVKLPRLKAGEDDFGYFGAGTAGM